MNLYEFVKKNENWLVSQIIDYAKEYDYVEYASTLRESWQLSITVLSNGLLRMLKKGQWPELRASEDYFKNPAACLGMLQAKRYRSRGVSIGVYLGLIKYYRRSYLDLIDLPDFAGTGGDYQSRCRFFINLFFDCFEIGISTEWAQVEKDRSYEDLRISNLFLTNEKNKYLAVFENLGMPVILLDNRLQVQKINYSALEYFRSPQNQDGDYYGYDRTESFLTWLSNELQEFVKHDWTETFFNKEYKQNGVTHFIDVKLSRILDHGKKFAGIIVMLNDLSGYKQIYQELRNTHRELDQAFNTAADGVWIVDKDFNILKTNDMFVEMSGVGKEMMSDKKCYEVFPGSLCCTPDCALIRITNGEQCLKQDVEKEDINGNKISCRMTAIPYRNSQGEIIGIMENFRDVTERNEMLRALRDGEEKFRNLFHNINDGIFVQELKTNGVLSGFVEINDTACQTLGYSRDELLGKSFTDLGSGKNQFYVSEIIKQLLSSGHVTFEMSHFTKDRREFPVEIGAHLFHFNHKKFVLSVARDITERKESEEILKRYRILFKYMKDIILFVRRRDGRIIEANHAATHEYGYSRDELLSKTIYDLRFASAPEQVKEQMGQAGTRGILFEAEHRRRDGSFFPVEVNSQGVIIKGEPVLVSIIRDITERKKSEGELRAAYRQLSGIIEFLPNATVVVDANKNVIAWNQAMENMTGVEKKAMIGREFKEYSQAIYGYHRQVLIDFIISGKDAVQKDLYESIQEKDDTVHVEVFAPALFNGKGAVIACTAAPLLDDHGHVIGAIEIIRDITNRKNIEEKLKYLSFHDQLTGLHNRTSFERQMKNLEATECYPAGIIVCDLDGLKIINDSMGHDAGDRLLKTAADLIKGNLREYELVSRIGGDEFAILLPNCDQSVVKKVVTRIKNAIKNYNQSNSEFPLHISMGFAVRNRESISMDELFKMADNNMYREKLHHSQSNRSGIIQTLTRALEARDFITEGHGERMQDLVEALALAVGFPEYKISDMRLFARFHDIGKVGIPDEILNKPGPLTAEEVSIMQRHSEIGYRIALSAPEFAPISGWILRHHEWWNGGGYPLGLAGDKIPLECRILTICDAYDAMTNDRLYRRAMAHRDAIKEIEKFSDQQFDPLVAQKFIALTSGFMAGVNSKLLIN